MSILIRGMEMPTDSPLWIVVHSDGTVEANDVSANLGWQILRNAAVPVPPHGRLIDQDMILREVIHGDYPNQWIDKNELLRLFRNAPTIIEAEVKE